MTLKGKNGKRYTLGKQIGAGGEGIIYSVQGNPDIVAKLYKEGTTPKKLELAEKKLAVMAEDKAFDPYNDGHLRFAWPLDLLYDGARFVGFIMPLANDTFQFHEIIREDQRSKFSQYSYDHSIAVAFNLAQTLRYVHDHGYVIGDMNLKNFRFDGECRVIVLDTDSFDVTDKKTGVHYKCMVGMDEYLAPELQGCGSLELEKNQFTRESDYFSLAVLIFRCLMEGAHPFNAPKIKNSADYQSSSAAAGAMTDIINGLCPYVRGGTGKKVPRYAPDFAMLPAELQELFRRTFDYTQTTAIRSIPNRATAEEFANSLNRFYHRKKTTCPTDNRHHYLSRLGYCPFCAAKRRQKQPAAEAVSATAGVAAAAGTAATPPPGLTKVIGAALKAVCL